MLVVSQFYLQVIKFFFKCRAFSQLRNFITCQIFVLFFFIGQCWVDDYILFRRSILGLKCILWIVLNILRLLLIGMGVLIILIRRRTLIIVLRVLVVVKVLLLMWELWGIFSLLPLIPAFSLERRNLWLIIALIVVGVVGVVVLLWVLIIIRIILMIFVGVQLRVTNFIRVDTFWPRFIHFIYFLSL